MLNKLFETELQYAKCFAEYLETDKIIRFWDDNLPGMYCHNFTQLKGNLSEDEILTAILEELKLRKGGNKDFLQIEANYPIPQKIIDRLPIAPEVSRNDFMYISPDKYTFLKDNSDCSIKEALTPEILQDGIKSDIIASTPGMGADFAVRRIHRKAQVLGDPSKPVNMFVCYHNNIPIGNCELLINGDISKIEDFSIIDEYQRKGFGTSVLKHLLEQSKKRGVEIAYLITDSDDTAKDMYTKCGFTKVWQKTILFFKVKNEEQ